MIQWAAVKAKLDQAAVGARDFETIEESMDFYNEKVIEALQLMISTASVDGGICTNNGPIAGGAIS